MHSGLRERLSISLKLWTLAKKLVTTSMPSPTAADYKRERELRGTQRAVATALDVSYVTIARRETGKQIITREAWLALCSLPLKAAYGTK